MRWQGPCAAVTACDNLLAIIQSIPKYVQCTGRLTSNLGYLVSPRKLAHIHVHDRIHLHLRTRIIIKFSKIWIFPHRLNWFSYKVIHNSKLLLLRSTFSVHHQWKGWVVDAQQHWARINVMPVCWYYEQASIQHCKKMKHFQTLKAELHFLSQGRCQWWRRKIAK